MHTAITSAIYVKARHCPVSATKLYAQNDSPLECRHQWTLVLCQWISTENEIALPLGQWIPTETVFPSRTISHSPVDVHWYGVAVWDRQSPWIHSSTQWIAYCPMNGVDIRCQSQLCLSSIHLVNVHWSGGAIRYQQSLPCIASFVPTMNIRWNSLLMRNWQSPCSFSHTH